MVEIAEQYARRLLKSGKIKNEWLVYRVRIRITPHQVPKVLGIRTLVYNNATGGQHAVNAVTK